jgi:hypothetical protein
VRPGRPFVALAVALALTGCSGGTVTPEKSTPRTIESVPASDLQKLANARVFFGHQSVGFNIVAGIDDILGNGGSRQLRIEETRDPSAAAGRGLFHAMLGRNADPVGKIRDFDSLLRGGWSRDLDIAFMKLCYADIGAETDVMAVFSAYRETMARLKADYPKTVFVHFTVPLVSRESGLVPFLKRMAGRGVRWFDANRARERLNSLLRREYEGKEPLFDLAYFESTRADGTRVTLGSGGQAVYALEGEYTDDGGHLNDRGRKIIAEQLIVFLAGLRGRVL